MALSFEVCFGYKVPEPAVVWRSLFDTMPQERLSSATCRCDGAKLPLSDLPELISRMETYGFDVCCGDIVVTLAAIGNHGLSVLIVDGLIASNNDADKCVSAMMRLPGFLEARLYDSRYDELQNTTDLKAYEDAGIDTSTLTLKSNGLPFPVEEYIVDTAENPGRRILRDGYIEAIGHRMWLSRILMDRLGLDVERLKASLSVDDLENATVLISSEGPFQDAETNRATQEQLRDVVFAGQLNGTIKWGD